MQTSVVGREPELARLGAFVEAAGAAGALVVTGPPGAGKTTLWEAALSAARAAGRRVVATRGTESELPLSFVALNDLLADVELADHPRVPSPQRHALEAVLYRTQPDPKPPDSSAAAVGLANLLRSLAAEEPLLVAIDDVSWLDRPSSESLAFAARRLVDCPIRFLLTRRTGTQTDLERALTPLPLEQLDLGGLTLAGTRLLLAERLGLSLPRRLLRRLHEAAGGNPLLALELGQSAREADAEDPLAVPATARAEELFGERVAALPPDLRRAVLAAALSPNVKEPELATVIGSALDTALASGLLVVDGGRVRAAHPLLAAAARGRSSDEERRRLHLELSRAVHDHERGLHHAALGTPNPDGSLAAELDGAVAAALARGAVHDAVELGQHAVRLTPSGDRAGADRLLALAELLGAAGELASVTELLAPRLTELPPGRARARAHLLLGEASVLEEHERQIELALEQAAHEPDLVATALAAKAVLRALIRVADVEQAEALAEEALATARRAPAGEAEARAVHALAWARILRGADLDGLGTRAQGEVAAASLYESALERPAAVRLAWRGQIAESRALLDRLLAVAEDRGEARSCVVLHLHRCELELRAGDVHSAARALETWEGWTADEAPADVATIRARCLALLAGVRGRPGEATRWADIADASNAASGFVWDGLEVRRARGIAALHAAKPAMAVAHLRPIWEHTVAEGIDDPGAFPVAADLVEAFLALEERREATAVLERLAATAEAQSHPWGLATSARCEALIRLAEGPDDAAAASLQAAAAEYLRLGSSFDAARTLLSAGRAARRQRQWRSARDLLERAAVTFDMLGADGWAELARAAGGRSRPTQVGSLTDAEQRVARLAADGLSNKEIATRLVLSVSTVETHLKRIYPKLGVRSRTQLANRVARGPS